MPARVVVVDDDDALRKAVRRALRLEGYDVELAGDGSTALAHLANLKADLVVLDVLMPGLDGVTVCRRLRESGDRTPVLMLTARDTVSDLVLGLDAGADDYLTKPFVLEELLARVRALLRRSFPEHDGSQRAGDLELNPRTRSDARPAAGGIDPDRVRPVGAADAERRHRADARHHPRAGVGLRRLVRVQHTRRLHRLRTAQDGVGG